MLRILFSRRRMLMAIPALAVLAAIALFGFFVSNKGVARGKLQIPDCRELNLGEGKPHEILTGSFRIGNVGQAPVEFAIQPGCNCASLEPRAGKLGPGEYQTVKVGVRLSREGSRERVAITIHADDGTAAGQLWATATCPAPLLVEPSNVEFGEVPLGQSPTRRMKIYGADGAPVRDISAVAFACENRYVNGSLGIDESRQVYLDITLSAPEGVHRSQVMLKPVNADQGISVPVTANVVGALRISPTNLYLRKGAASRAQARFLIWRTDGSPLGSLVTNQSPSFLVVREESAPAFARRLFRVQLLAGRPTSFPCTITLTFDGVPEPIKVRVFCEVSELANTTGFSDPPDYLRTTTKQTGWVAPSAVFTCDFRKSPLLCMKGERLSCGARIFSALGY